MHATVHVFSQRTTLCVSSPFLSLCGSQGSNPGHQSCSASHLSTTLNYTLFFLHLSASPFAPISHCRSGGKQHAITFIAECHVILKFSHQSNYSIFNSASRPFSGQESVNSLLHHGTPAALVPPHRCFVCFLFISSDTSWTLSFRLPSHERCALPNIHQNGSLSSAYSGLGLSTSLL